MPPHHKPTQADVARLAGVSQAMVSYVVNGSSTLSFSEETRRRILGAIEQLGYIPDRSARSLRTRKTRTIAVVLPDITNPYHPAFARGAQDMAEANGYGLIIYNTDGDAAREKNVVEAALQHDVDGLIGAFQHLRAEDLRRLCQRGTAVVLTEWYPHPPCDLPLTFVGVDNRAAAEAVVGELRRQGRGRIAHISGVPGAPPTEERLAGFCRATGLSPQDDLIQPGDFSIAGGRSAMQVLLALPEPPDAVFAVNDLSAIGALEALQDAGVRVPKEVALIGFDDIPAATIVRPALSTVRPFQKQIGARAAQILIEQIENGLPTGETYVQTPFELVRRASS